MLRPEVVSYLQQNLKKFPVEDLRRQLASEGVSDLEFDDALAIALRAPPPPAPQPPRRAGILFLAAGVALVGITAILALTRRTSAPEGPPAAKRQAPSQESAFVGQHGFVVRLPKDYTAVQTFKDPKKTVEIVHFCKAGTDPTSLLDEGLYGQLGIVRLEASPSELAGRMDGLEALTRFVTWRGQKNGEKFAVKNLQVSTLRGIQVTYESPSPRVEAYILGERLLYSFLAGQEDEIYRDVITSLRDQHTEM